jgi:hypothetical protein
MNKWLIMLLVIAAGCTHEPFTREPLPALQNADPNAMRESFAQAVPARFISDDSIIVDAPFHDEVAILGVIQVDRVKGTFEVIGLNQVGIKLFDLAGDRQNTTVRYAIPPLMEHKDILIAAGDEIRRMYFNLVPDSGAKAAIEKTDVKYTSGKMVYKLGGNPAVLLEKRENGLFGPDWRVQYFKYTSDSGRLYPRGLVMDNGTYHYRIIIKNRDIDFGQ